MFVFLLDAVKTCDLPVTCKKTIAEASFLCGVEDRGKSSNPLTHANRKRGRAVSSIPFLVRVRPGLERVRSTLRFGRC